MRELVSSDEEKKRHIIFKKPKKNNIQDQDTVSAIKYDQNEALARYRNLVQARREKEKLRPREPEVYHHDIFKK